MKMKYNHTTMEIIQLTQKNKEVVLEKALFVLKSSGLIIYPTETCYGAGVVATDQKAVKKLLQYKKRPSGKAISIAVADKKSAKNYVDLNKTAENAYKKFLPGPVTIISKSKKKVGIGIESEFGTLGIRIPDYEFTLQLLKRIKLPISATSANSAGKKTPYQINDILSNISQRQKSLIDLIIDVGELPQNPPSSVIDTTKGDMQVLRSGRITPDSRVEIYTIKSEDEMKKAGNKLIKMFQENIDKKGLLLVFNADLGSGKTYFVKGVASSLGIKEIIKSPTYSLIEEYDISGGKLVHIDAWRLENISELQQLGIEKYLKQGNVVAIEWSGAVEDYLLKQGESRGMQLVSIEINYIDSSTRKLKIIY